MAREKTDKKRIVILASETVQGMIADFRHDGGYDSTPDTILNMVRYAHGKKFPAYTRDDGRASIGGTPEERAEKKARDKRAEVMVRLEPFLRRATMLEGEVTETEPGNFVLTWTEYSYGVPYERTINVESIDDKYVERSLNDPAGKWKYGTEKPKDESGV